MLSKIQRDSLAAVNLMEIFRRLGWLKAAVPGSSLSYELRSRSIELWIPKCRMGCKCAMLHVPPDWAWLLCPVRVASAALELRSPFETININNSPNRSQSSVSHSCLALPLFLSFSPTRIYMHRKAASRCIVSRGIPVRIQLPSASSPGDFSRFQNPPPVFGLFYPKYLAFPRGLEYIKTGPLFLIHEKAHFKCALLFAEKRTRVFTYNWN